MSEYDGEPVRGLPAALPAGETILWQGSPLVWPLAQRVFHLRMLAVYFVLLEIWHIARLPAGSDFWRRAALSASWMTAMGAAALALLIVIGWLIGRTTVYTITSRRVLVRFGVALPMTLDIPFPTISAAAVRAYADGSGDLTLALIAGQRASFPVLWPHVRPWRLQRVEPMLRSIPQIARVRAILAQALAEQVQPAAGPGLGSQAAIAA